MMSFTAKSMLILLRLVRPWYPLYALFIFVTLSFSGFLEILLLNSLVDLFINKSATSIPIQSIIVISIFIIAVYVMRFFSRLWRITLVNNIVKKFKATGIVPAGNGLGWVRALYMEIINTGIFIAQIIFAFAFIMSKSGVFGGIVGGLSIASFLVIFLTSRSQHTQQKQIFYNKKNGNLERGSQQVMSRVNASERAALICNVLFFIAFFVLFYLYEINIIGTADALVFIFALRFFAVIFSNLAGSVMRLQRCYVYAGSAYKSQCEKLIKYYGM